MRRLLEDRLSGRDVGGLKYPHTSEERSFQRMGEGVRQTTVPESDGR